MKYIAYYRVSTKKQGADGNGIKAQRAAVANFLSDQDTLIEVFTEVESGTNKERPVLSEAVQLCKDKGATLLVAKLDRLSRNVKFLFTLKDELADAGVGFVVANNPDIAGNALVLGVMASMAEHEANTIQRRTKEGIAQSDTYKAGQWGNPRDFSEEERQRAHRTVQQNARQHPAWRKAYWFIKAKREDEGLSYSKIADALNAEGYRTREDKKFFPAQVRKVYLRYKQE